MSARFMSLLAVLVGIGVFHPTTVWPQPGPALSRRNASYRIEARLDPETRILEGRQVLTWHNIQSQPATELWFHLYWNGFRNNRSTWLLEDRIRGRSTAGKDLGAEGWAFQRVNSVLQLPRTPASISGVAAGGADPVPVGPVDLTPSLRYEAPDDGNPEDRTVFAVSLPQPVAPGETVEVELSWTAKIPRVFARTGYRGDFYFVAHWFPKLGVFEGDGWNCHQFHSATEFFSDYGVYDVELTVPEDLVLGATGRRIGLEASGDGMTTHRYHAEDVHGFAWTASPVYLDLTDRFDEPGLPPVELRLLLQPEHEAQAQRHFEATRAALLHYGRWYGPYPYDQITIVDPAYGSGAGGMEYPTLFTAGTRRFNVVGAGSPEGVVIHEAGHQFWYGVVGNNEFEHAWLDEGLNTFSTARAYQETFGERRVVRRYLSLPERGGGRGGFLPLRFDDLPLSRQIYGNRLDRFREAATSDDQATETFRYYPSTASQISYSKTSLWLATLERYLGWETLQRILSTFYQRWSFRHPGPEDFFAVAEEVSGQDLDWFFDQVHGGSQVFDYAVGRADSRPFRFEGYREGDDGGLEFVAPPAGDEKDGLQEKLFRTEVMVQRKGDGIFPVDVLMTFEDGSEIRRSWDGRGRWTLFVEEGPSKLTSAVVDPDRILLLDLDATNNSRLVEPRPTLPAYKWGSRFMVWFQDFLQTLAFFV
ncbi:MAG: M1 family metallopeptidase [Acidobacteria bacterium]|nr:M1 family metallopeptidase [Acidobacteriota bacterium]